ncbi:sugar transferase [Pelorhabdus rhamnosifermentans]|uniref:sugar transferase n=1 Tax=Pelorhabdus rhamnosifermentans TaxID=2772457 RepID=UPI002484C20F|nr:sugar transferase [Pelorhabdus rhamnosifermentans]
MDFVLSLCSILVLSPVILIIAFFVRVKLGSPVFFKQQRPGVHEKIFKMVKFRTMTDERGEDGKLLADEKRLNRFGKLLRSTSLDELPELINILKGDMSIVGPRPLLVQYLPLYDEYQRHRHDVRPGLTGYAQIHGRNAISWEEKFALDVEYTQSITFLGDWKIIIKTVIKVFKREGINSGRAATMEAFRGRENKGKQSIDL